MQHQPNQQSDFPLKYIVFILYFSCVSLPPKRFHIVMDYDMISLKCHPVIKSYDAKTSCYIITLLMKGILMKHNYQYLLFDADDTLLDFKGSEQVALQQLFDKLHIELTPQLKEHYHTINHSLWAAFERGEITRDEILATRFRRLFEEENIKVERLGLEAEYQELLGLSHLTIPGVADLLDCLKEHYELYIVTNGVATTQYNRLNASGLYPYFKQVFISEETGYQKPQIEFFDYVSSHITGFQPSKALIIGDSLASDIQGGINAGIDTCWYNPRLLSNTKGLPITYTVSSYEELKQILI